MIFGSRDFGPRDFFVLGTFWSRFHINTVRRISSVSEAIGNYFPRDFFGSRDFLGLSDFLDISDFWF